MSYQLMTFRHPHIVFFILLPDKSAFMYTGSRHYHDNTRSSQACLICNIHTHCKAVLNAISHVYASHPTNPAQLTKCTIVDIVCNNWDHCVILSILCIECLNGNCWKNISLYCSIIWASWRMYASSHILQIWRIILSNLKI